VRDGDIVAAAQEERFSRKKHDAGFPRSAVGYCLKEGGLSLADVDYVVFYDKPLIKFERLLETYLAYAPVGFRSFAAAMPIWLKEKLFLKDLLRKELTAAGEIERDRLPPLLFTQHHQSHAASAFYPSPFRARRGAVHGRRR
jgi:carbamoyltransferase